MAKTEQNPKPIVERNPELTVVATYRRTIGASLERVWENVLDWEHLPWVHAGSFAEIKCIDAGLFGWRAEVIYPGGVIRSEIALTTDFEASQYVTRVLDGPGAGGEIWTKLTVEDDRATRIVVDFCMDIPESVDPKAIGDGYLALYRGLWNEDEEMMQMRQVELDRLADGKSLASNSLDLGSLEEVRARLPIELEFAGGRYRVLDIDGDLRVHSLVCPHSLGPLRPCDDQPEQLICPWHGYRFEYRTGKSCDGRGLRLPRPPELSVDPETMRVQLIRGENLESQ